MKCFYCSEDKPDDETRPYGPNGSTVCFDCAMATPEREAETERNLLMQMQAAGPFVVIGSPLGPYPVQHNPTVSAIFNDLGIDVTKG